MPRLVYYMKVACVVLLSHFMGSDDDDPFKKLNKNIVVAKKCFIYKEDMGDSFLSLQNKTGGGLKWN